MPGLSQLRKFNQNLLSIGDELNVRSSRGEKPVRVKIPNDIADIDDSEEYVLGMPEISGEVESEFVDEKKKSSKATTCDKKNITIDENGEIHTDCLPRQHCKVPETLERRQILM